MKKYHMIPFISLALILFVNIIMIVNGSAEHAALFDLFGPLETWKDGTFIYIAMRDYWPYFYLYAGAVVLGLAATCGMIITGSRKLFLGMLVFYVYELLTGVLTIFLGQLANGFFRPFPRTAMTLFFQWFDSPAVWSIMIHYILMITAIVQFLVTAVHYRRSKLS